MSTAVDALGCYIAVDDARRAVDFYVEAFDARRRGEPYVADDGRIGHAEVTVGDSVLMLAAEFPEIDMLSPRTRGGPASRCPCGPPTSTRQCGGPWTRALTSSVPPPTTPTAATESSSTRPGIGG